MKNTVYTEECFSSHCGLCSRCTDAMEWTKKPDGVKKIPSVTYAEVIQKFEKPRINDMTETYMNKMIKDKNREMNDSFRDATEQYYGIFPQRYIADESPNQESIYIRQETPHSLVCDMPLCQAMYNSLPTYTQNSKYSQFPVYVRQCRENVKHDVPCTLCYECISKCGNPRRKPEPES